MNNVSNSIFLAAVVAVASLVFTGDALAQFEIVSYSIDSGGGESGGGDFIMAGAIGQPDTGESSGGDFAISGGFVDEPSFILGDVNGDGVVNLLDVTPFVEAITTGNFVAEADINGDGVVNLLDVDPFVDLLIGN